MTDQQLSDAQNKMLTAFQKAMVIIYKFAIEEFAKEPALKDYEIVSLRAEDKSNFQMEATIVPFETQQDIDTMIKRRCRPCPHNPNACCFG